MFYILSQKLLHSVQKLWGNNQQAAVWLNTCISKYTCIKPEE